MKYFLVANFIVVCILVLFFHNAREQAYCECMGRQVYINTKWHGRCLINVTDYNDSDTTVLLFEAMEICR